MKINACGLQEAILEVVEVEEHIGLVQRLLRITFLEIQASGTLDLNLRQKGDGTMEQLLLSLRVSSASVASALEGIKEGTVAQIHLQVTQSVCALCHHGRNGQLAFYEMLGKVAEGTVLVHTGTYDTYQRTPVRAVQTVILTITACTWELVARDDIQPCMLSI
jgi:hypothetical protein